MTRALVTAVVALLVVVAAAPFAIGSGAAADNVTLTIKTVDSDGDPRGGVSFMATWDDNQQNGTTTESSGEALLEVPEGAEVTIRITDDRFTRNEPYVIESATAGDVEVPVSLSGTATVTVTEQNNQLANADVVLTKDGTHIDSGTTSADGTYETPPVETGRYTISVSKPGYYDNSTTLFVSRTTDTTVTLRSGAIKASFNVTDDHFDPARPLADVTIEIPAVGTTLTTLGDGTQSTELPVNRDYEVTLSKDGYQSTSTTLEVGEESVTFSESIQRVPEMRVTTINDQIVVGGTSRITAINEYDEPVVGATVSVDGEVVGETNEEGQMDVPIESEGNVTIEVAEDGRSASLTIEGVEPAGKETPTETVTETETVTATETATETTTATETATETPGGSGPGFGVVATLLAALASALLVRRR